MARDEFAGAIVFSIICLLIGKVVDFILSHTKIPIPSTVFLFYFGVTLGVITFHVDAHIPKFLEVSAFSSTLIVYGFLPILLFSEAMTLNRHHLYQYLGCATYLAGPGAVMVCFLLAMSALILPYHWTWNNLFLFASILCATDPVSVVALLKSTKASTKLTMTIAGESILNDGSAMIMYIFFFNMLNGVEYTAGTFISFVLDMLIVSPLLGIVFGALAAYCMRLVKQHHNDYMDIQVLITFVCTYLSFFVAGYLCEVSGVLSCAIAGVTVSYFGPIRILEHHDFHSAWEKGEWICNTLIFLFAGFIGGGKAASVVDGELIGYLVVMYVFLVLTRGFVVAISKPVLNWMGYDFDWRECFFMTYAGLRGALGIALALEGAHNAHERGQHEYSDQLFFFVTGLASMTLLFNGPTAGMLLLKLGLIDDPNAPVSPHLQEVHEKVKKFMTTLMKKEMMELQDDLGEYNETKLHELCHFMTYQEQVDQGVTDMMALEHQDHAIASKRQKKSNNTSNASLHHRMSVSDVSMDLLVFMRTTFLEVVRSRYRSSIHHERIGKGSSAAKLLLHSVDVAFDDIHTHLSDWDAIIKSLKPDATTDKCCKAIDDVVFVLTKKSFGLTSRYHAFCERVAIYTVTNFIDAHQYAQKRMAFIFGFGSKEESFDIARLVMSKIFSESNKLLEMARKAFTNFPPEDTENLYTHRAAKMVIHKQMEMLNTIIEEGILSDKDAKEILEALEEDELRIKASASKVDKAMVKTNVEKLFEVENIIRQSISGDIPMNITLNKTEALALESTTSPMQTTHIAKNRSEDKGDIEENEDN